MKSKQAAIAILILLFLFNGYLFSLGGSQDETAQTLIVTLFTPADGSSITTYNCNFTYRPTITGTDTFISAKLIINGTETTAANQTAIVNAASNRISYTFSSNGTYIWNVQVQNSTNNIVSPVNFTITVAVPLEPAPTLTPNPTPAPTSMPTPTPTPTPTTTATPTPTPTPTPSSGTIVTDGWTILIIGLVILAIILAVAIVFLRKESR
jgi:hypothetical protein